MAVSERKLADGSVVFWVSFTYQGKVRWEHAGKNRRDAERLERRRKSEVKDGVYDPENKSGEWTVEALCSWWGAGRTNRNSVSELSQLRRHVVDHKWLAEMNIDDVRPRHMDRLVKELRAKPLTDKTISNVIGSLKLAFNAAIRDEKTKNQPVVLAPRALKREAKQEKQIYSPAEIRVLTRHSSIPAYIRVLNALLFFTGMREGEACGRRWKDLDDTAGPLAALMIYSQYGDQPLKTDRPRIAPIHPELAAILEAWALGGFELYTGRKPKADDFIVPNVGPRSTKKHFTRSAFYKAFVRYSEAAGVEPRSVHSTRHTFISLLRRAGARKDLVAQITHNAKGDIVDQYTHTDWEPLCSTVSLLNLDSRQDAPLLGTTYGKSEGRKDGPKLLNGPKSPKIGIGTQGSIPGASTKKEAKNSQQSDPSIGSSQDSKAYLESLLLGVRVKRRRLLALEGVDRKAARPALAILRGLQAALEIGSGKDSRQTLLKSLVSGSRLLGGTP